MGFCIAAAAQISPEKTGDETMDIAERLMERAAAQKKESPVIRLCW